MIKKFSFKSPAGPFFLSLLIAGASSSAYAGTIGIAEPATYSKAIFLQETVKGVVTDGVNPLAGVTVAVKGSAKATSTDVSGNFSIAAKKGDVIVFTSIGFSTVEEVVVGSVVNVVMTDGSSELDEVVVTGYSTQKKGNVTAAVATIDAAKLKDVASPNLGNMLQGKVAGVDITSSTGRPGDNPNIRIRGKSSIYSNVEPLWVVDGVIQHTVPNLNPSDVESMSILKDAAATTQYGSRGSNGVIVVTTKRAKQVGTSTLNASVKTGASYFNNGNFKLSDSRQLWDNFKSFTNQNQIPADVTEENVLKNDYDWVDNGTQAGNLTDVNLTYMGRTEKASIYAAGNYYTEKGSIKGFKYDRWSGRMNLDYEINDRLTIRPKINGTYTTTDDRQHSLYEMYLNMPWDNPYDANGKLINPKNTTLKWYGRDQSNYLYDLQYNYSKNEIFDLQVNGDFDYKISDYFTFVSTNNIAYYNSNLTGYVDPRSISGQEISGSIQNKNARRTVRFTNQMLKYARNFGKHAVSAFAAYEYMDYMYKDFGVTGKVIVPGTEVIGNAADFASKEGTKNEYAAQSGILNATYSYDDRYNLQGSYRYDGSSRFGSDVQYGSFYAFSAAWNVHRESFFDVSQFDYLRMRVSYGKVGNVPTALYGSYDTFKLDKQYDAIAVAYADNLGNPRLTWETSKDFNTGVEFGLLNRFNVTFDFYNKNTDGQILFVQLPITSGYTGYYDNIGAVRNRGVEFSVNADIFSKDSPFQWNLGFNIAKNDNKITQLRDGKEQPAGIKRYAEGRDIDSWYMRKWSGVDPANGDPLWERIDPATGEVSTTNEWNDATLQFVGTATPKYSGGITSGMKFKDFYLNANFVYSKGAYAYNMGRRHFDSDGAYPYYNQIVLQDGWSRWSPDNPNATHPAMIYGGNRNSNQESSRYLEDASFIRLRNVTLGYQLAESIAKKVKVKGLGIYVSGDNLWTGTKFSGQDPEVTLFQGVKPAGNTLGDGDNHYPTPRRFTIGVNVTL